MFKNFIAILFVGSHLTSLCGQDATSVDHKGLFINQTEAGVLYGSNWGNTFSSFYGLPYNSEWGFTFSTFGGLRLDKNFSAGIESGVDIYSNTIIPVLAHLQVDFNGKISPFIFLSLGSGFPIDNPDSNKAVFNGELGIGFHTGLKTNFVFDLTSKISGVQYNLYSPGGSQYTVNNSVLFFCVRMGIQIK